MSDNEQVGTTALRMVMEFDKNMKKLIDEKLGIDLRMKEANTHHVRTVIRHTLDEDSPEYQNALTELEKLKQANHHVKYEPVACRLCQELNAVIKEGE